MKRISAVILLSGIPVLLSAQESIRVATSDTTRLREVVVTGQFGPQSLKSSVYRVRTIGANTIRLRAANNLESLLGMEAGIRFSNDLVLGESDIQLMGMSGQNVKILLDGVPLVDRGATKQSLSQIDIHTVERVEIVEGPMSVVYGTDALAGVINIITKKGAGNNSFSLAATIREETTGEEYSGFTDRGTHNSNVSASWSHGPWAISASGSRNNFGGWKGNATGRQNQWNPKEQVLLGGKFAYRTAGLNAWYRLDYLDETISGYGDINPNNYRARDQFYVSGRYTHQLHGDWKLSESYSLTTAASYQKYDRNTRTTIYDATSGSRTLSTGIGEQDKAGFKSSFLRSTLQARLSDVIAVQPGIEITLNSGSGQRISGNPQVNDYALFLSAEIVPVKFVSLRPGVRYTDNSVYDAPRAIPSLNTKIGLTPNLDLRMAWARGFRAPALRELYFTFFDASHSIQGNENLEAEYSSSFNAYLSWQLRPSDKFSWSTTLGGFSNRFHNQITTGFLDGNTAVTTYINIDKFSTRGLTLEGKMRWRRLDVQLGAAYIGRFNRISENNADLPGMLWSPELNTNVLWTFAREKMSLGAFYKYNGARPGYQVSGTTGAVARTSISAFSMADLNLTRRLHRSVTLNCGVRNLFDVTSISTTSTDTGGAHSSGGPVPIGYGRSWFLGLNLELNGN